MPVPEIDRLAHEILDILGDYLPRSERPNDTRGLRDRALVTVAREISEIDSAREPFDRRSAERLQACYLRLQLLTTIRDDSPGEFQSSPVSALFRLYAALERAEMQERATPTPNLDADEVAALPLRGRPDDDVSRHQEGEGTR